MLVMVQWPVTRYTGSTFSQTVIFDCCHLGSGTGADSSVISTHCISYEKELFRDLEAKLLARMATRAGSSSIKLAAGFLNDGLESHVLFAPCNSNEVGSRQTDAAPLPLAVVCTDKISYTDLRRMDALLVLAKLL